MKPQKLTISSGSRENEFFIKSILLFVLSIIMGFSIMSCSENEKLKDGGLRIGWAIEDITPDGPVSLKGQYYERISTYVQSPLKATAMAIESVDENGHKEQAIMVSVDVVSFAGSLQDSLKSMLKDQIPDFNINKLILNVTHTHSSFDTGPDSKHRKMLLERLSKVSIAAWNNRKPGGISRELQYVVVGHNRRVEYADGTTEMYGSTDREDFIGLEGSEDSGVEMLFCWDLNRKLTGIIMNVSCPAQVTEAKYYVSADYWSEVRKQLKKSFSEDVYILTQIGAAGDISPRDLPRGYKSGEPNMWDVSGIVEIGKRLGNAVDDAYPDAKNSIQTSVVFKHIIKNIELPARMYSEEEYKEALEIVKKIRSKEPKDPDSPETAWNRFLKEIKHNEGLKEYGPWDSKLTDFGIVKKKEALVKQYENQDKHSVYSVEIHIIRLGDVAFATNPFELFVDYGFRISGRSKAKQTFIMQLSSGDSYGYLPTRRAVEGNGYRGYSAMVNRVGPEGGQMLVDTTVSLINRLWEK
ncbi:MAG: hypothetical protein DRI73_02785 [Bacteroidetes bacterium]|nr:MAG: hypothetical protein DRI73_02785 [Bacteroidota bacterium]